MEKRVSAYEVRRSFGQMLQEILANGDRYVVERHGTPVAVVVPIEVYEQWKQSRDRFFETLRTAQAAANLTDAEATQLVDEVIKEVRAKRRS